MRFHKHQAPPGGPEGEFVSLSLEEMRAAYATFVAALRGDLPPDADFPADYVDEAAADNDCGARRPL